MIHHWTSPHPTDADTGNDVGRGLTLSRRNRRIGGLFKRLSGLEILDIIVISRREKTDTPIGREFHDREMAVRLLIRDLDESFHHIHPLPIFARNLGETPLNEPLKNNVDRPITGGYQSAPCKGAKP